MITIYIFSRGAQNIVRGCRGLQGPWRAKGLHSGFRGAWGVAGVSKGHREPWGIGVRQGVTMDPLKFYLGPPCLNLLCPVGGPPLKRPNSCFRGGPPIGWVAYSCLLPLWKPHAVCLLQGWPAWMPGWGREAERGRPG
jgi:hypothetical protein